MEIEVSKIKDFTLHDCNGEMPGLYKMKLRGELISRFIARNDNEAISEFIKLVEIFVGRKF